MMLLLLAALSVESPPGQPAPPRLCGGAGRGNAQLAYRPYGSAVFGSDGLHCTTVKTDDEPAAVRRKPAALAKAKAKAKRR